MRKNILIGPISKNKDSKLMQMLSPSSGIYLCHLLPIIPKSYNILTMAIHTQYSMEQCMLLLQLYCQCPFLQMDISFPSKSREALVVINLCCDFHLE